MKLRKNLTSKLVAVGASLLALGSTLVLVHRNPPASADTAATQTPATSSAAPTRSATGPATSQTQRARTHTRTHVS